MDRGTEVWDEPPGGSIAVVRGPDGPVMHLSGDVDATLLTRLGGARLIQEQDIVAVDVRELGYIDSSGLALLARWARTRSSRGEDACVRGVTARFDRVLSVSGLTDLFVTEP